MRFTLVAVGFPRGARPNLGNITVTTIDPGQTGLGADNAPLSVVQQTMGRDMAVDVFARPLIVSLDIIKYLLQGTAIEKVFQFRGAPPGVHRTVRRLPVFVVIGFPFAFKPRRISRTVPKFGFFQINRLGSGVQGALDTDTKKFAVIGTGRHVIDVTAMPNLVAISIRLRLVLVIDAV